VIRNLDLAWAFRILAVIVCVVNGVCCLLIRDRNAAVGAVHVAFHKQLFKRLEFYLFMIWGFFSMLGYTIVVYSISDYGRAVGLTATQGALLAALFNRKFMVPRAGLLVANSCLSVSRAWPACHRAGE